MNEKITPEWIAGAKARGEKVPALTAYDYPMARLLDEAGVPVILVGDSLGMVVLGYPDTTQVTLADIRHHLAAAVARAKPRALVVADLPYHTYDTPEAAVINARILVDSGAEAVKLEGGIEVVAERFAPFGRPVIAVMGHIGMLPQSVKEQGGYKIKGRSDAEKERLLADALAVQEAGAFAVVMELVEAELAGEITARLDIPTIGIGSGTHCGGQILVTHDLVGAFPWFRPKFADAEGRHRFKPFVARRKPTSGTSKQLDLVLGRGRRSFFASCGWLDRFSRDGAGKGFRLFVPHR